jgi:prevent-host-death family protein
MRRTSLVDAKSHLSELVDRAEHKGQPTLICRHGKPAAAIVPVEVAEAAMTAGRSTRMSSDEIATLLDGLAASGDPSGSALRELREGRSRLDATRRPRPRARRA